MASSICPSPAFHSPSSSSFFFTRSDTNPHNSRLSFPGPTKFTPPPRFTRPSSSLTCRCLNNNNDGSTSDVPSPSDNDSRRWIQDGLRNAVLWFDGVVSAYNNNTSTANLSDDVEMDAVGRERMVNNTDGKDEEWDWDRWKQHFTEVDDQERIVSILKVIHFPPSLCFSFLFFSFFTIKIIATCWVDNFQTSLVHSLKETKIIDVSRMVAGSLLRRKRVHNGRVKIIKGRCMPFPQ